MEHKDFTVEPGTETTPQQRAADEGRIQDLETARAMAHAENKMRGNLTSANLEEFGVYDKTVLEDSEKAFADELENVKSKHESCRGIVDTLIAEALRDGKAERSVPKEWSNQVRNEFFSRISRPTKPTESVKEANTQFDSYMELKKPKIFNRNSFVMQEISGNPDMLLVRVTNFQT